MRGPRGFGCVFKCRGSSLKSLNGYIASICGRGRNSDTGLAAPPPCASAWHLGQGVAGDKVHARHSVHTLITVQSVLHRRFSQPGRRRVRGVVMQRCGLSRVQACVREFSPRECGVERERESESRDAAPRAAPGALQALHFFWRICCPPSALTYVCCDLTHSMLPPSLTARVPLRLKGPPAGADESGSRARASPQPTPTSDDRVGSASLVRA